MPTARKYLTKAAADAAPGAADRLVVHCLPGCYAWHLAAQCPTPGKVRYRNSYEAHRQQPGARNAGMHAYLCRCGSWHWGHKEKSQTTIGRALARGSHVSFLARKRAKR